MTGGARRPFWFALAFSVLMHAAVITAPGWGLPDFDEGLAPARLDTRLVPANVAAAVSAAAPATPSPVPATPRQKPPAPSPETPVARTPDEPVAPPPPPVVAPVPPVSPEPSPPPVAVPSGPTFAEVWPRAGRLVFKILRADGMWVGKSVHEWQHDGQRYRLRAVTETVGLAAMFHSAVVVQESRGILMPYGLQPLEFNTLRDGKLRESARIDLAQNTVFLGSGHQSAPISGPVQDVISLFHQHGAMPDEAREYSVMIATGRRVGEYHVSFEGMEKLDSPWGERSVRRLRMYSQTKSDGSEIWLDEITRLPFKIRYRDGKGDVYDQIIEAVELGQSQ